MQFNPQLGNCKVLVIDDVTSMRNITKGFLREAGLQHIDDINDGAQALEKLNSSSYDLIICDWDIPSVNGLDLLKNLRSNNKFSDMLFFMVTSTHDLNKVTQSIEAGVTEYIVKPYQPEYLLNKVTGHLLKRLKYA